MNFMKTCGVLWGFFVGRVTYPVWQAICSLILHWFSWYFCYFKITFQDYSHLLFHIILCLKEVLEERNSRSTGASLSVFTAIGASKSCEKVLTISWCTATCLVPKYNCQVLMTATFLSLGVFVLSLSSHRELGWTRPNPDTLYFPATPRTHWDASQENSYKMNIFDGRKSSP